MVCWKIRHIYILCIYIQYINDCLIKTPFLYNFPWTCLITGGYGLWYRFYVELNWSPPALLSLVDAIHQNNVACM
jgi:hypothetical protein